MNIIEIISVVTQNSWVNLFALILAPIGMFFSIFFFFKSRRKKSVRFFSIYNALVVDFAQKIDGLNIQFSGKEIQRLTVSKIAFWNSGTETITHNDIPSKDKISIDIDEEFRILSCSIIAQTNITNNISVCLSQDGKKVDIDFEYLEKQDGFVIQIFHTGDSKVVFNFNGTVMGFGKVSKGKTSEKYLYDRILDKIIKDKAKQRPIELVLHSVVIYLFFYVLRSSISQNMTLLPICSLVFVFVYGCIVMPRKIKIPSKLEKYLN